MRRTFCAGPGAGPSGNAAMGEADAKGEEMRRLKILAIWMFPKIGVPQNRWFIMEHPIKMDDLGVPLFLEKPISVVLIICHVS